MKTSKELKNTAKKPPNAGNGRPKGSQNKMTKEVKQMILDALDRAGGVAYLAAKAESHPGPFMALVGKVLPLQLTGDGGGPMVIQITQSDENL